MIYLDYAAATPMDPRVLKSQEPYFYDKFFNPSSSYSLAREVRYDYESARHKIAQSIGAKSAEIIITAGATESINLALAGISGDIVTTAIEHKAVLEVAKNHKSKILPVDNRGRIDLKQLDDLIDDQVELVSVGYANSEIGTIQPIKEISEIISNKRRQRQAVGVKNPLVFHTDASQAAGYLDINVARLGIDLMTLNAGKCYGPKQVGLLFVRSGIELNPLLYGGGQEMGLRSGTENVAGAIGFSRAIEIAEKKRKAETDRIRKLRDDLEDFVVTAFPNSVINGHSKQRLPNILNFSIPGLDGERAVFALDISGVMCATGSACAANKGTKSHVLSAIGLDDSMIDGSLRLSLGRFTNEEEIAKLKPILKETITEQLEFGTKL